MIVDKLEQSLESFAREAFIIQVDIDKNELGSKIKVDLEIHSDVKEFLLDLTVEKLTIDTTEWLNTLKRYKEKFSSTIGIDRNKKVPNVIVSKIASFLSDEVVTVDVGQHQMWVAQSLHTTQNQRVLFSGGMGAMGFALPSAIGAAIASDKRVVAIAGDGGIQMNIQELEILKRRQLPIKIFVLNNQNLGMVRQFQELYFDEKYSGTVNDYSVPDLVSIAKAYGLNARNINNLENIDEELKDTYFSANEARELVNICSWHKK
ncbi:MAG: thiamine pyrophosphate-dependent enzyme [Sulfurimonas sp.]|nr:thiamine pyrophosphate-dependent enzyme [Sulfurimonas sp.]